MLVAECYWLAFVSVPQQEVSPLLEAWVRGAESAPRLVAGAGLAPRSRLCVEFLHGSQSVGRRPVRSADGLIECVVRLWHVDRACNMVSAKTLDNMCKVMKEVMGMKKDLYPHGSRELVDPKWVTDKPMTRKLRGSA